MARYILKNIPLAEIQGQSPFQARYSLEDEGLFQSVLKRGVLEPVSVLKISENSFQVITGVKRTAAAKRAGLKEIPALEIQEKFSAEDLFMFAVISNWKQELSELDRAWILFRARSEFKMASLEELMSILGLPNEDRYFGESQKLMKLHPDLLSAVAAGDLPCRGAQMLSRFSSADQEVFAKTFAGKISLTANQMLQMGEWLSDIMKLKSLKLQDIFHQKNLAEILNHPQMDKRQKGEGVTAAVKALRFPNLALREQKLKQLSGKIRSDFPDLGVEVPPSFEAEGFTLKMRIRRPESIDEAIAAVKSKKNVLNSLFDFML